MLIPNMDITIIKNNFDICFVNFIELSCRLQPGFPPKLSIDIQGTSTYISINHVNNIVHVDSKYGHNNKQFRYFFVSFIEFNILSSAARFPAEIVDRYLRY